MGNFKLLAKEINIDFIIEEMESALERGLISSDFNSQLFNGGQRKIADLGSHSESGWVRIQSSYLLEVPEYQLKHNRNSRFLYKTELYQAFPNTITFLEEIAKRQNGTLQRVVLVLLLPNGKVLPHRDMGEYYKHRDRYHLILKSEKGSEFSSGDEKQIFKERELWWFANKEIHSVKNLNDSDRIHLIFDILPKNHFSLKERACNAILSKLFQIYYDVVGKREFSKLLQKSTTIRNIFLS